MANLDQIADYMADYVTKDWTEAGHVQGSSNTVTIPDTAKEVLVMVLGGSTSYRGYSSVSDLSTRWELGGYYLSSNDWGVCNVNVSNSGKTYQIRNMRYAGTNYGTTAHMYVFCR